MSDELAKLIHITCTMHDDLGMTFRATLTQEVEWVGGSNLALSTLAFCPLARHFTRIASYECE